MADARTVRFRGEEYDVRESSLGTTWRPPEGGGEDYLGVSDIGGDVLDRYLDILEGGFSTPSAPGMFPPPPERDIGQEYREIIDAQIDVAPDVWALEREYRPKYAALDLGIMAMSQPVLNRLTAMSRTQDVRDLERLGPRAVEAARSANPNVALLLDELSGQAQAELERGGELSPDHARAVEQATRAGYADRGLVHSNPAITEEVKQNCRPPRGGVD